MNALVSALMSRLEASGEKVALTVIGYMSAMLLLVAAILALAYAVAVAVSDAYGPIAAALAIAAAALSGALAIVAWLNRRSKVVARQARLRRGMTEPAVMNAATHLLPAMLKASPMGTLVAIAAAAYVVSKASQQHD